MLLRLLMINEVHLPTIFNLSKVHSMNMFVLQKIDIETNFKYWLNSLTNTLIGITLKSILLDTNYY